MMFAISRVAWKKFLQSTIANHIMGKYHLIRCRAITNSLGAVALLLLLQNKLYLQCASLEAVLFEPKSKRDY